VHKVIVIGGGSFQGKSLVAIHIAREFNIPTIISTDMVRNILRAMYPGINYLMTSTYLMPPQDLTKQMEAVSSIILKVLPIYEQRGEDVIIEGMHLSEDFLRKLSRRNNVFMVCLDNQLPLRERLRFKAITRTRVEYRDPRTGHIVYDTIDVSKLDWTPYMRYATRIEEIHREIVGWFKSLGLPIIRFTNVEEAKRKVASLVRDWLKHFGELTTY